MSDYVELGKRINRNALEDAWQHERARADAVEAELVEARERLRRCEERLAAVEALHIPDGAGFCAYDGFIWPCTTVRALGVADD